MNKYVPRLPPAGMNAISLSVAKNGSKPRKGMISP